jgi:hypothetical protein
MNFKCLSIDNPFSSFKINQAWGEVRTINREFLLALLFKKIFNIKKAPLNLYKKILKKTGAKIVFSMNASTYLCEACHSMGIPIIEVLHGMGYTFIPWGWEKKNKNQLPNYVLASDDVSLKTFQGLSDKGVEAYKIEHPLNKRFLINKYKKNLPNSWLNKFNDKKQRKIIVIALQWGYDKDEEFDGVIENGILYSKFKDLFKITEDNVFWGLRLHQVQISNPKYSHHIEFVKSLACQYSNVDWNWFSNAPLPSVLLSSDGCITMSSMTSYDAASFGLNTLALCPHLREDGIYQNYFTDLEKNELLIKREFSLNVCIEWLKNLQKNQDIIIYNDDQWLNFIKKFT